MKILIEPSEVIAILCEHVRKEYGSAGLSPEGNGICVTNDKDGTFQGVELDVGPAAEPVKKKRVVRKKRGSRR